VSQFTFTTYWFAARNWRGRRAWFLLFRYSGNWALSFRVLWLGVDIHNNCVWSFEEQAQAKRTVVPRKV
jgi:hypothetical protein